MDLRFYLGLLCCLSAARASLVLPNGCGSDFGCYSDCSGSACEFLVTWKDLGVTGVQITISYVLPDTTNLHWAAVGFSDDIIMGGDSVNECVMQSSTFAVVISSYNFPERYNQLLSPDDQLGVGGSTGGVTDGVLTCSFIRETKIDGNPYFFDLNQEWHMLFAAGQMDASSKLRHSVDPLPSASLVKINLQSTSDVSNKEKAALIKVHGCLMVFAWVFATSIGLVLARHYKPLWPNSKICGEKVWFAFHRLLMVSTMLACVAAFIIIFVEAEAWSEFPGETAWKRAHPIIGVIVTALVIINPLMAICRPRPDSSYRYIFKWSHWIVGIIAYFGSMINLVIGVTLAKAALPDYLLWIVVAFVIYQVILELILEFHDCRFSNPAKRYTRDGYIKEIKGSSFKKIVLAVHVFIITGFTIAIVVLIAIN